MTRKQKSICNQDRTGIDPAISDRYGIYDYGARGMEVIRNSRQSFASKDLPSPAANWRACVEWAQSHPA